MTDALPDVDATLFRQLLASFATGVSIITARDNQGDPVGMTASSLTSVSFTPPLLSVCVDVTASMHRALSATGTFIINILAADQQALSQRFAAEPAEARFRELEFEETETGLVILRGTLAYIVCERFADFPLGDHTLFVGRITGGIAREGQPLLYYRGNYGTLHG